MPEDRGAFFDLVVALVRKVVHGDVRTGYLGELQGLKRGGVAMEVCSFHFWSGVDGRAMIMRRVQGRMKGRKLRRMRRMNRKRMLMKKRMMTRKKKWKRKWRKWKKWKKRWISRR